MYIHRRVVFDHLDKAFCILKLDTLSKECTGDCEREVNAEQAPETDPETGREGRQDSSSNSTMIRRVDLIVSPPDQYPFALVSWTGSKVLHVCNRSHSSIFSYIPAAAIQPLHEALFCKGMWYVCYSSWHLQYK